MGSNLVKFGLSVFATSLIFIVGTTMFPYDFKEIPQQPEVQKEFVKLYQEGSTATSPRVRLVKDLKELYSSENPSSELVSKVNSPDQSYPLLDREMKDFVYINTPTGRNVLTEETVQCSMGNNKLFVDGKEVSQDYYRITSQGKSTNPYYNTCTKLVTEMNLNIRSEIPSFLLTIENGEFINQGNTETQAPPTGFEAFFNNLLSLMGVLKILTVLLGVFLATFLINVLGSAKSLASKTISQLKSTKSRRLTPQPAEVTPTSFMDEVEYEFKT